MPNFVQIVQYVAEMMTLFRFFKMAAVRHLGFVVSLFGLPFEAYLVVSVTMQDLFGIGAVVAIIFKFKYFERSA